MLKVYIVDDSRLARNELKHLLEEFGDVQIVGETGSPETALEQLPGLPVDLLLLDIEMPGNNGFELLQGLDAAPEVIFVTAFDSYALKAFEFNALDYLLKPLHPQRLRAAIEKVRERLLERVSLQDNVDAKSGLLGQDSQIFVKDGERCWFVLLENVRLFEVVGSYTAVHFEGEKPLVPRSLNQVESRLNPRSFFRANRQQIVNLQWVENAEPWFSGGIRLTLKGGEVVEISRRQALKFRDRMSL